MHVFIPWYIPDIYGGVSECLQREPRWVLDELLRRRIEFGVLNLSTEGNVTPAYALSTNTVLGLDERLLCESNLKVRSCY